MRIVVQEQDFSAATETADFGKGPDVGAVVTFSGIVRDLPDDPLQQMVIEHYPGMTEKALTKIAQEASARWDLRDVLVIHRYGALSPGEQIMMVATAARHRAQAFEAAEYLMDYLKSRAPFWKKEVTAASADWVDAKDSDEAALDRW
ncbi:molybdenum cofactor biosynthesis protein MoaE [Thalassobacter stenotrophicus]|uniref:molybdenum cofactor biosynthesis protein MoaE n=1 Tax=Thalassobacter TaxID=266808 RepID=UPI00051D0BA8|nr:MULTISPECIES: molybdenum cofactor biosynthesis protein MoaE [Thalassobacter]KGK79515.1 molybdenum cofactor biosynthesis protein MoaE [Thalassobacter stenotrophicus]KGL01544.1 molybdenum cofactor biosynthesis protein MoaE [Thalassobacter sp. 16PALIMAR09]